jgi:hypothetical protein
MEAIIIATVAALPPTIAAMAAFRKARQTNDQVTPSNGKRLAQIVEANALQIKLVNDKVDMHIHDPAHHQVCANCLTIEE